LKTGHLIVKSQRPGHRRLFLIAVWAGFVFVAIAFYQLGQLRAGYNIVAAEAERSGLQQQLQAQQKINAGLSEQVTILDRTQAIDRQSYDVVRNDLKLLQEEILELREEVEFYRGIVSPVERSTGLNIQTFKLEPAVEEGLYHFDLVMTQLLKNEKFVKGVVKLFLQGVQDGEPLTLNFSDISPNESVEKGFRFRYFQKMAGDIRLPEGFVPRTVLVELSPNGRKSTSKSFPWLVSGD